MDTFIHQNRKLPVMPAIYPERKTNKLVSHINCVINKTGNNRWQQDALSPDVVLENFQAALAFEGGIGLFNPHTAVSFKSAIVEI